MDEITLTELFKFFSNGLILLIIGFLIKLIIALKSIVEQIENTNNNTSDIKREIKYIKRRFDELQKVA